MPATDLEQLVVTLSADIKQYENALAKAQQVTVRQLRAIEETHNKTFDSIEKRLADFGLAMKAGVVGAASAVGDALLDMVKDAVKSAAEIGILADKLGISTDALQGLTYGAAKSNMSFDELSGGLLKFSKNLGEAASHSGQLYAILKANGVSVTDASGKQKTLNQSLSDFADLVKNAQNEQQALALITAAFGKGSDGFLQFLRNGASGLKEFQGDAKETGSVIHEQLIRNAQIFDEAWAEAIQRVKSNLTDFTLSLAPIAANMFKPFFGSQAALGAAIKAGLITDPDTIQHSASGKSDLGIPLPGAAQVKPTVLPDPEADARAKKLADDAAREAARRAKAIKDVIEALSLEYDNLGRSNVQQQIYNELKKAGTTADTQAGQAIVKKVQAIALEKQAMETAAYAQQQLEEKEKQFYEGLSYLAETGVSAFDDLIQGGKSLNDVLSNVLSTLVSATIQASLLGQGPLAGLFGTQSSAGGLGGFFGSLLSAFNPSTPASIYHSGGIAGMGGLTRNVHPGVFAAAPRYHGGGIAGLKPGEIPAILQYGEKITPRGGMRAANTNVTVIDQRTNAPPVERQQDSKGNLRLLIRDEISGSLAGGSNDKALGNRFAARPVRIKRG